MSSKMRCLLQRGGSATKVFEVMQFDVLHLEVWQRVTPRLYNPPLDEPIYWVTSRPDTLMVYRVAHRERQLQWLLHRAAACKVELRKVVDYFPAFMAILADLAPIEDDNARLSHAQALWELWTGQRMRQSEMPAPLRKEIHNQNLDARPQHIH
jgi:hypothetical protein